ncbi:hypothetical protein [uncultured Hymenobacter sp.]|uniref:hypothetical protein n=1 Tax=uncultured Hymenobacter sp. TaxID=170016 RepID=UPI0035C97B10
MPNVLGLAARLMLHDCRGNQLAGRLAFEGVGSASFKPDRLVRDVVRVAMPGLPYCRKQDVETSGKSYLVLK